MNKNQRQLIAQAVTDLETLSEAELVVVVRKQSSQSRSINYILSFILVFISWGYLLFSPMEFHLEAFFLPLGLMFSMLTILFDRVGIFRWLTGRQRQVLDVTKEAHSIFMSKIFGKTKLQTGILIYISLREKSALLFTDLGVQVVFKEERRLRYQTLLQDLLKSNDPYGQLAEWIATLGIELARALPAANDINYLSNLPDVEDRGSIDEN